MSKAAMNLLEFLAQQLGTAYPKNAQRISLHVRQLPHAPHYTHAIMLLMDGDLFCQLNLQMTVTTNDADTAKQVDHWLDTEVHPKLRELEANTP